MHAAHNSPRPLCSTTVLNLIKALGPPGARQLLRARATSSPVMWGGVEGGALDLAVECAAVAPRRFEPTGDGDAGAVVGDGGTTSGVGDGAEVDA